MILLDTHILLWWEDEPARLSSGYRSILETTKEPIAISTITCWEIAMLARKGRMHLPIPYPEWMRQTLRKARISVLELSLDVIDQEFQLPKDFHKDPADRIIAATTVVHHARLATMDRKLIAYPFLNIL